MYSYTPTPQPKKAIVFVTVMFTLALTAMTTLYLPILYAGLIQLLGTAALVAGIFVTVRYLLTKHRYYIAEEGGVLSLGVEKIMGKKILPGGCVSLASVKRIGRWDKGKTEEAKFEEQFGRIEKSYDFCQNLFTKDKIAVMILFNESPTVLYLEGDDRFLAALRYYSDSQKQDEQERNSLDD